MNNHKRLLLQLITLALPALVVWRGALAASPTGGTPNAAHTHATAKSSKKKKNNKATQTESPQAQIANKPILDKWVLVIGVGKFTDSTIPTLKFAAKDATDFAHFLVKNANFAPDHVRLLIDEQATQRRIMTDLGDKFLPRVVKPGDVVLVYFSGHGSPSDLDVKNQNYLVAYDTEISNLFASGVDMQTLVKLIKSRVDTDRVLLVFDACHSGAASAGAKSISQVHIDAASLAGEGQLVICSSQEDELSWESKRYANGVFTKNLIQAMQKDGASATVGKIFSDMRSGVHDEVQQDYAIKQTPVMKSQWNGDELHLAAAPVQPGPLPPSVKELLDAEAAESAPRIEVPTQTSAKSIVRSNSLASNNLRQNYQSSGRGITAGGASMSSPSNMANVDNIGNVNSQSNFVRPAERLNHDGLMLQKSQRWTESIGKFQESLRMEPGNRIVRRNLASVCEEYAQTLPKPRALMMVREALFLQPDDPATRARLGRMQQVMNLDDAPDSHWTRAEECVRQGAVIDAVVELRLSGRATTNPDVQKTLAGLTREAEQVLINKPVAFAGSR